MATADFDYQDFSNSTQSKLDEQLLVRFFVKSVEDKKETMSQGRPCFTDREYIEIRITQNRSI